MNNLLEEKKAAFEQRLRNAAEEAVNRAVEEVKDQANRAVEEAKDQARDAIDEAKDQARDAIRDGLQNILPFGRR